MSAADRWSVELSIREHEGDTRADARLVMDNDPHLLGHGTAPRNPSDPNVMEIGEKIAVARALSWRTCFSAVLPHRSRTSLTSGRSCTCDPVCVPAPRSRWAWPRRLAYLASARCQHH